MAFPAGAVGARRAVMFRKAMTSRGCVLCLAASAVGNYYWGAIKRLHPQFGQS
jgi:hypothetical protein